MPRQIETPPRFLWGAAISAYQTEGANRNSDWWLFEIKHNLPDHSGRAVDHWHRYREDIDLLAGAELNAFRCSVEWARIEPSEGTYDEEVLRHYDEVLAYARYRGIRVCLTLWHFSLPLWAAKKGGMLNPAIRKRFEVFADLCGRRYRNRVTIWITMNEPMVYLMEGYRWGTWPPGMRSRVQAIHVFFALRDLHRRAYRSLRRAGIRAIGIAKSAIIFQPTKRASGIQHLRAKIKNFIWNHAFFFRQEQFHDIIGINYYITDYLGPNPPKGARDDMGWISNPKGLQMALREYEKYKKPLYVTENGIATDDDHQRVQYIQDHLTALHNAQKQGSDVRGYFYWSLLDNFEWAHGFSKRFGLIAVDRKTMERKPKPSLRAFGDIAQQYADTA